MNKTIKQQGGTRDTYLELVKRFPLTSIRDGSHFDAAQAMLDSLMAQGPLGDGQEEYLEALSDLIWVYESRHVRFEVPDDCAVLAYLLELKGISQGTLAVETNIAKSTISEVLSQKRSLTRAQVARLAKYFGVGQGVFALPNS